MTPILPPDAPGEPTRAIALRYEAAEDDAPRIVATGQGGVAEQILQLAFAHGVKVRQDAPLVEILSMLEVDSLIPLEAYAAVAEILSYVYKANAAEARVCERRAVQGKVEDSVQMAPQGAFTEKEGTEILPPDAARHE